MEWLVVRCTAYFSLFDDRNTAVMQPSVPIGIWLLFISSEILCSKTNDSYKLTVPPNYLFTSVLSFLFFFLLFSKFKQKKEFISQCGFGNIKNFGVKNLDQKGMKKQKYRKSKEIFKFILLSSFFFFFSFFFVWKGFFFVVVVLAKLLK